MGWLGGLVNWFFTWIRQILKIQLCLLRSTWARLGVENQTKLLAIHEKRSVHDWITENSSLIETVMSLLSYHGDRKIKLLHLVALFYGPFHVHALIGRSPHIMKNRLN
jgi:hypothetical protein